MTHDTHTTLLTIDETAELLRVSRVTLWTWRKAGIGPVATVYPTGRVMYAREAIDAFLGAGATAPVACATDDAPLSSAILAGDELPDLTQYTARALARALHEITGRAPRSQRKADLVAALRAIWEVHR